MTQHDHREPDDDDAAELRRRFAALARDDAARAPGFDVVLRRARTNRRAPAWGRAALAGVAASLLLVAATLALVQPWRAPPLEMGADLPLPGEPLHVSILRDAPVIAPQEEPQEVPFL
jgi:hypothetical protein